MSLLPKNHKPAKPSDFDISPEILATIRGGSRLANEIAAEDAEVAARRAELMGLDPSQIHTTLQQGDIQK